MRCKTTRNHISVQYWIFCCRPMVFYFSAVTQLFASFFNDMLRLPSNIIKALNSHTKQIWCHWEIKYHPSRYWWYRIYQLYGGPIIFKLLWPSVDDRRAQKMWPLFFYDFLLNSYVVLIGAKFRYQKGIHDQRISDERRHCAVFSICTSYESIRETAGWKNLCH